MRNSCFSNIPLSILEQTQKHPCYSVEVHQQFAVMHLPVAPTCNIQCNYCNRSFDCINENRPGVTSENLTPALAIENYRGVKGKIAELDVVGIAGPGDALADWQQTKETIEQIKKIDPDIVFCLSTNGLLLAKYAPEIVQLGIHHVTVTINAVNPVIGAQIYKFVLYEGMKYEGLEAAQLLYKQQLAGIEYLADHGVLIKINVVMLKGINDQHIPDVVKKMKELGAFIINIIPLIPAPGSSFAENPQVSEQEINEMRKRCQLGRQQVRDCGQCRVDKVG
ncbi:nitrogenase cofactor biosynthesis protein NifB [Pelosinus propionicus]|uniref:FeMo cofactor biosynthesis protein NifB n=1 Tax=Pelosinus propionicus DSM 13327 TaxID=1123291 RepID=A0A1I4GN84_9FIRM|nr:nitrogenase cofactor biosynthesis protein NifB [Pelosinus propionicus]SFL31369.1 nitrogen fixation protein NifB [Pelosinus propionicus DSM 13327]